MGKGDVVVCDVVEEVDLALVEQETCGDGVDWCIPPSLVEETTIPVQRVEEVDVGLRSEPVQIADLEVGPLMA